MNGVKGCLDVKRANQVTIPNAKECVKDSRECLRVVKGSDVDGRKANKV